MAETIEGIRGRKTGEKRGKFGYICCVTCGRVAGLAVYEHYIHEIGIICGKQLHRFLDLGCGKIQLIISSSFRLFARSIRQGSLGKDCVTVGDRAKYGAGRVNKSVKDEKSSRRTKGSKRTGVHSLLDGRFESLA